MASLPRVSKTSRKTVHPPTDGDGKLPEPPPHPASAQERAQVAQLLHDTVCQELTGIGFLAVAAAHHHQSRNPQAEQQFREIADLIQRAGTHLAEIVHKLRSPE